MGSFIIKGVGSFAREGRDYTKKREGFVTVVQKEKRKSHAKDMVCM